MKKLNLLATILVTVGTFSAQTTTVIQNTGNNASNIENDPQMPIITKRFNTDYPNTHATWTRDGANYRADYTMGTLRRSITYYGNGRVACRDEEISSGNYPERIYEYYNHKFPNEPMKVWLKTDTDGNKTYYIQRNVEETYWFEETGKYKKITRIIPQELEQRTNAQAAL